MSCSVCDWKLRELFHLITFDRKFASETPWNMWCSNVFLFKRLSDCVSQHSSLVALFVISKKEITEAWISDENGAQD